MGPKDGPASPPGRRGPRIPRRSARLASALLVVLAALCGVGAIFRGIELNLIGDASYEQAAASDRRLFILALVHLGVGAVTSVVAALGPLLPGRAPGDDDALCALSVAYDLDGPGRVRG